MQNIDSLPTIISVICMDKFILNLYNGILLQLHFFYSHMNLSFTNTLICLPLQYQNTDINITQIKTGKNRHFAFINLLQIKFNS